MNDSETRQAVVHNVSGVEDTFPCISLLHFLAHGDFLNLKIYLRSSNVEEYLAQDIVFLNDILQDISKHVKLLPGRLTIFIASAHTYI